MNADKGFFGFLADIFKDRKILVGLAENDFKARFAASMLGGAWAFIQPLVTILVFWFIFEVGLRNAPVDNVPYILWFSPAFLVWNFFSETLVSGSRCLLEYSYLVKKVNFRVGMLPLVKILSAAFIHAGFLLFILFLMLVYGIPLSVYNLQLIYYFLCTILLLAGLCWLFSAVAPFLNDVVNIVGVLTQIGFWATPIIWSPDGMGPKVQMVLKLNPMFYICRGYRDAVIEHIWFWERTGTTIVFWVEMLAFLFLGIYFFRKLRPQFADVL